MSKKTEEIIDEAEESIEEAEIINPPEIDSKYRMIILAAQRSKQLQRGATPRVDLDSRKTKPTQIALRELEERKINFSFIDQHTETDSVKGKSKTKSK